MSTTIKVAPAELREGDILVHPTDSSKTWYVTGVSTVADATTVTTLEGERWVFAFGREFPVLDHDDDCGSCVEGVYHGFGYTENGVFKGVTGQCFRCGGKGYQDRADRVRNAYYDNHVRRIYA